LSWAYVSQVEKEDPKNGKLASHHPQAFFSESYNSYVEYRNKKRRLAYSFAFQIFNIKIIRDNFNVISTYKARHVPGLFDVAGTKKMESLYFN
jgi:hypothetical protein